MDNNPVGEFLRARRETVQPEDVGLYVDAGRRVSGLRREEVAQLAGISSDYYLRLEQGKDAHPSDQVVNAIAKALLLDDQATAYLQRLVSPTATHPFAPTLADVDPADLDFLTWWDHSAAYVTNGCQDVLAANALAGRLAPGVYEPGRNLMLALFSDTAKATVSDWETVASEMLAATRERTDANDPRLHEIVGELSLTDTDFRRIWARHDVKTCTHGTTSYPIHGYGVVELRWQQLSIRTDPRLALTTTFALPGSQEETALRSLLP
ncbi:helix-turn-helix transcriptional regulator [Subtercola vilae]|uniref:XRE family transcriptional regulator n=1 Tax=Subtercola vilae TaxID=2056433 RepID=A0A4T2C112_9MICO|nr:helix-turn-helix transcriptional regulator [Subtercola vilae]TIH37369.1 XRE family transcriptional regulator [Subtercola vilae]